MICLMKMIYVFKNTWIVNILYLECLIFICAYKNELCHLIQGQYLCVKKTYAQKMGNYFIFLIISSTILLDFAFPPRS